MLFRSVKQAGEQHWAVVDHIRLADQRFGPSQRPEQKTPQGRFGLVPTTPLLNREARHGKHYRGGIAPELWDDIAELVVA